jgi:hypothetical protein
MANKGPSFEFRPGSLGRNLRNFNGDMHLLVAGVVDYQGQQSIGWMKSNARWVDRTGNARQTLSAYGVHSLEFHEIHLHGGMPYQIWLELRWGGKYAVIGRAVQFMGLALMNRLRGLVRKVGKL